MANVVLINPFEVPEGQEEEFLAGWRAAAEHLRQQEGFISTRLHKSLDPATKFQFINVAEWASPQHFEAAMRSRAASQQRAELPKLDFVAYPALYEVLVEALPS